MNKNLLAQQMMSDLEVKAGSDMADCWDLYNQVIPHTERLLTYGPPGTGKTTGAVQFGRTLSDVVLSLTLTEETPAAELRGHYIFKGGDAVWQDGPATIAFRKGYPLVLNELNHASADTLSFLLCLLDDPEIAMITLPNAKGADGNGEVVMRHPNFRCFATMNGEPDDLPVALRDRFATCLRIDKPHPLALAKLPEALRNAALSSTNLPEERRVSVRSWLAFHELSAKIGDNLAAQAVFGDRYSDALTALKLVSKQKK